MGETLKTKGNWKTCPCFVVKLIAINNKINILGQTKTVFRCKIFISAYFLYLKNNQVLTLSSLYFTRPIFLV
jgi:hypothetical protein